MDRHQNSMTSPTENADWSNYTKTCFPIKFGKLNVETNSASKLELKNINRIENERNSTEMIFKYPQNLPLTD